MSADDRAPQGQSRDIVKQFTDLAAQPEVMDPDDPWRFDGYNAEDAYRAGLEDGESRLAREWLNEVVRLRAALSEQELGIDVIAYHEDHRTWVCRTPEVFDDMGLDFDPTQDIRGRLRLARTQSPKEGDDATDA